MKNTNKINIIFFICFILFASAISITTDSKARGHKSYLKNKNKTKTTTKTKGSIFKALAKITKLIVKAAKIGIEEAAIYTLEQELLAVEIDEEDRDKKLDQPFNGCVNFYNSVNYSGGLAWTRCGAAEEASTTIFSQDSAPWESVKPGHGSSVVIFDENDFKGNSKLITSNTSDLGSFKDKIKSFIVEPAEGCIGVFEDHDFEGDWQTLCGDRRFVGDWNDEISSIKLGINTRLIVFEHEYFGGKKKEFTASVRNLNIGDWNDKISSWKVVELNPRYNIVNVNSNKCADVSGSANSANIYQYDCHKGDNQKYKIEAVGLSGDKYVYAIWDEQNSRVWDAASDDNGGNIHSYEYHGNNNQRWYLEDKGNDNWAIKSVSSGRCADVFHSKTESGANIQIWDCHYGNNQLWKIRGFSNPNPTFHEIKNVNSNKCMDASSVSVGANVYQYGCHQGDNQKFAFLWQGTDMNGNNRYNIFVKSSKLALDAANNDNHGNIYQNTLHGKKNQIFAVEDRGNDNWGIKVVSSSKCFDIESSGTNDGDNLQQYDCHYGNNQLWKIPNFNNNIQSDPLKGTSKECKVVFEDDDPNNFWGGYQQNHTATCDLAYGPCTDFWQFNYDLKEDIRSIKSENCYCKVSIFYSSYKKIDTYNAGNHYDITGWNTDGINWSEKIDSYGIKCFENSYEDTN